MAIPLPSRNNGYVSPSRRNGHGEFQFYGGVFASPHEWWCFRKNHYNGGSVQNYGVVVVAPPHSHHKTDGHQPGQELTTADVSRALGASRRNGDMVKKLSLFCNDSLRGDRCGYGYGDSGEVSCARRGSGYAS